MSIEKRFVEFLRFYRHDILNQIQLIKGSLALGQEENAHRYMDQFIIKAQDESRLTQMFLPEFTFYILTYNWDQKQVHLEYEIDLDIDQNDLLSEDKRQQRNKLIRQLEEWTILLLERLETIGSLDWPLKVLLTFIISQDNVSLEIECTSDVSQKIEERQLADMLDFMEIEIAKNMGNLKVEHYDEGHFLLLVEPKK